MTDVVFILDMSGSMYHLTSDTVGGYNKLLEDQKKTEGEAHVTTVFFNDKYTIIHDKKPIQEVQPLTNEYQPTGMTALLDAVGKTICNLKNTDAENVIVTIITDGLENCSREFTWKQIQDMIKERREKNWIFTFIGANIDVMEVSDKLGIDTKMAREYTSANLDTVYKSMSKAVTSVRTGNYEIGAYLDEVK